MAQAQAQGRTTELTRLIGYLAATGSEDQHIVSEMCVQASLDKNRAKEAISAIRLEFKYSEPTTQLHAARLWETMLKDGSEVILTESVSSRKFQVVLEDLLTSSRTSPTLRKQVLGVIASLSKANVKDKRFKALWARVQNLQDASDTISNPLRSKEVERGQSPTLSMASSITLVDGL